MLGIISALEALFSDLSLILPMIDALPLSPELAAIRLKVDSAVKALKAAGL